MADVADHESRSLKFAHGAVESYFALDDNQEVDSQRTKKTTPKHIRCSLVFVVCTVICFALVAGFKTHTGLQGGSTDANVIEAIHGEPRTFAKGGGKGKKRKKKQKTTTTETTTTETTTTGGGESFSCATASFTSCGRSACAIDQGYLTDETCAADLGGGSYAVGTLNLGGCTDPAIQVPNVTIVCGNVQCEFNGDVNSVAFPVLESVGRAFSFQFSGNLNSLDFPVLSSVGGAFGINVNGNLNSVAFPVLSSVGTGFGIDNNGNLNSLDFPALSSVGDEFQIGPGNAGCGVIASCTIGNGTAFVSSANCKTIQASCVQADICIPSL